MKRQTAKQKWRTAYGMARATWHSDKCNINPKLISAVEYVMCAYDRLGRSKPGKYLAMLRQKHQVIASGGFWIGFKPMSNYNCRCAIVAVPADATGE